MVVQASHLLLLVEVPALLLEPGEMVVPPWMRPYLVAVEAQDRD